MPSWLKSEASLADTWLGRLVSTPIGRLGTVTIIAVAILAIAGPWVAPYDPLAFHRDHRLEGPSAAFWLGTDQFGRDILSRILAGAPASILFGVLATALGTVLGTTIGIVAGFFGGAVDNIIMRVIDALMGVPNLLLILLILTVMGSSTTNATLAVGLAFAPGIARIARSVTLSVRTRDFVSAARARGEGNNYIMSREILPNVLSAIVIEASIRVAVAILIGATLSFLGLGAQPPASNWGLLIADARPYLFRDAWLVVWPGVFIAFVAVAFNLLGDGLRDAFNPRLSSA